jgi:transposase
MVHKDVSLIPHNHPVSLAEGIVVYKARLAGVPVLYVDPSHMSKACSLCGCIDDRNRPVQATFFSGSCG